MSPSTGIASSLSKSRCEDPDRCCFISVFIGSHPDACALSNVHLAQSSKKIISKYYINCFICVIIGSHPDACALSTFCLLSHFKICCGWPNQAANHRSHQNAYKDIWKLGHTATCHNCFICLFVAWCMRAALDCIDNVVSIMSDRCYTVSWTE